MSKSASPTDAMRIVRFGNETPPVRRIPNALARRFFQICTTATAESVADADLAPLEFAVMAYVSRDADEADLDQSRLAERLGIDRNNVGLLLERLETKGLLERRVNGRDRRARMVRLTLRGEKLWQRLAPIAAAGQRRILAVLAPADREKLLDLLVQVIEGNRAMARPGTGRRKRRVNGKPSGGNDAADAPRPV